MRMRISVFVDAEGNALPMITSGMIKIFQRNDSQWELVEQIPLYIHQEMGLGEIRKSIYQIAPNFVGCRILIVKNCVGILKAIFEEELHLRLILVEGDPVPFLEQAKEQYVASVRNAIAGLKAERERKEESIYPVRAGNIGKDCFRIDLTKVQGKQSLMNSKEILVPFFEREQFRELEIICLHTPKWIEKELPELNYTVKTEWRKDGTCRTFVYPKQ